MIRELDSLTPDVGRDGYMTETTVPPGGPEPRDDSAAAPGQQPDSPFGERRPTPRSRARRAAAYAAVVLGALVVVFVATRGSSPERTAGNEHAGMAAGASSGDTARSVMLGPAEAQRIGVTYAVAMVGPLSKEVRTVGQVTYDETRVAAIAPKVDGWIEQLYVNYTGQPVRRGQPLFSIYSPMLVTAQEELLLARRLTRDVAGGTPDAIRSAHDLLASTRRRLLYWDVPQSEVDRIERTGTVRRAVTLVSPATGFVVDKSVFAGQKIMAGEALYRVADLSVVWVEGEVFEQDLAAMRVGQGVVATFEAFPGEQWLGQVSYIYPTLNAETRTVRVRVQLANAGGRLKPGMYATLLVRGTARAGVLSVPRSAVLATGERTLVFVKRPDGMLEPRDVAVGMATSDRIEVRDGLAPGDIVVASATFLVDAESNLRSALGGMGNMPGMDITAPAPLKDRPGIPLPGAQPKGPVPNGDHGSHEE